ncbi:MAG TPA: wax ester/triacylglycerol synthase family O-acyltransferase [Actinomycetes bacterium]|nr:wax ester/triacylglycerol synthase family O-acyltransferase [Actinomycetes bacterium]
MRMSNVDAAWLGMDAPDNLMMVTGVLWLEEKIDRERLAEVVRKRLLGPYPKFSMRALPTRTPFEQPVWTDDPDFDLDRHLVDGGECAGDDGLAALVSDQLGRPLDMTRPPWQLQVVSVRDAAGPRTAVVARLHHCIADGIALAGVLLSLTDDQPEPPPEQAPAAATDGRDPRRPGLVRRVADGTQDVAEVTGVDVLPRGIRQAARAVGFAWRVVVTGLSLVFASRDPRTRLHGRIGTRKVAAWCDPIDLRLVKRLAGALGVTVNDVLLAATAGALRSHLLAHGDRPHDLRIFVPVDLRPPGEPVPPSLGNRFGLVFLRLPVAEPDVVARVHAVHERMGRVKGAAQAASTFALLTIIGALPSWGHRLAVRLLGSKSGAVVTNVPGPREPVWLADARVTRIVFWVPQAGSVGLGVSILSYAGDVTVGVAADHNLVPEPGELTTAVRTEIDALVRRVLPVDAEVTYEERAFDSAQSQTLVAEVQQEYVRRYGGPDETRVDPAEFAAPGGTFLVALVGGETIGCAGLRRHGDGVVEVKRMFVRVEHRRRGHARRMLAALEDWARDRGATRVVLETGMAQPEAIALYESAGYLPIDGFGHYRDSPLSRSFAKDL